MLLLMSCAENKPTGNLPADDQDSCTVQPSSADTLTRLSQDVVDSDNGSTAEKEESKTSSKTNSKSWNGNTDKYDDGYEDGAAFAEEDRLAGRPGMQAGGSDDDDDEDYEDGFDDGYE